MSAPRRPWTRLASAALAGHVFFELAAGVGMPGASVVGPAPAAALWAGGTAAVQRAAGRSGRGTGPALANGLGWPRWSRTSPAGRTGGPRSACHG